MLVHVGFAVSLFFNRFIIGVRLLDVGYWSVPGPGFHVFSVLLRGADDFARGDLVSQAKSRRRRRSGRGCGRCCWPIVGLWVFGTNDMMPILGPATPIRLRTSNFIPLGSLAAIFYVVIIGYSVLQHRLLDIHVTLSRFAAQFVRLLFMMLVGFALLLLLSQAGAGQLHARFRLSPSMGVLLVSALVASFFFPQFFGKGSDKLERQILGDRFEYHARVQEFDPDHAVLSRSGIPAAGIGGACWPAR